MASAVPAGLVYSGRERQMEVRPPRRDVTIVIDGVLDEPVWREAVEDVVAISVGCDEAGVRENTPTRPEGVGPSGLVGSGLAK